MANDNIGVIACPITNELAAVRRDCRQKLYYYSQAGKIAPNLPEGQRWLSENTVFVADDPARFHIKEIARGAPPIITEGDLIAAPQQKPQAQPAPKETPPPVPEKKPKKKSVNWGLLGVFEDEK